MANGQSKFQVAVTDRLRLDVDIKHERGDATEFSLNLCGLIDGEWEELVRFDNAHGSAHRHTFHPDGSSDEHSFLAVLPETFIAEAQKQLMGRAEEYLDDYQRDLSNLSKGVR